MAINFINLHDIHVMCPHLPNGILNIIIEFQHDLLKYTC